MDILKEPWLMAFWFGSFSALSLPLGAVIGIWLKPKNRIIAAIMSFGAGALIAALTLELVRAGLTRMEYDPKPVGLGCLIGAFVFVALNSILNEKGGFLRKYSTAISHLRVSKKKRAEDLLARMSHIDIFRLLPPEEVQDILPHVEDRDFPAGSVIFRQGEAGDALYMIEKGTVRIEAEGRQSLTLGPGETFGEMALVWHEPRSGSAIAETDLKTYEIHAQDFNEILIANSLLKKAVSDLAEERRATGRIAVPAETASEWKESAVNNLEDANFRPDISDIRREAHEKGKGAGAAFAMWLGIFIDGIPESLVIGASMTGASVSPALIGGLFLANLPESMSSATMMKRNGTRTSKILWMWISLMVMTGVGAMLGNIAFQGISHSTHAVFEGLAAGAMLAMIAQTMLPEAYEQGGSMVGIMTVLGFLAAIFLQVPPVAH